MNMVTTKDMSKVYFKKTDLELRTLVSKKKVKLDNMNDWRGWYEAKEMRVIEHQIEQINAVLESRKLQLPLL